MSNKRTTHTFEFEESDAPILMHAFAIAATTAMMCGSPKAKERLAQYRDLMKKLVPVEATWFSEEAWCEIGMALAEAKEFLVTIEAGHWEKDQRVNTYYGALLTVRIGNRRWQDNRPAQRTKPGSPEVRAVYEVLQKLAPMDCEGRFDDLSETVR